MGSLARLEEAVLNRFSLGQGFALATLNLDHLAKLDGDPAFRTAYAAQDMITADGNPIIWMARLAGQSLDLLPGSDLILPLTRLAAAAQINVGLIGSTSASLELAADALRKAVPNIQIKAQIAPPMGFEAHSAAATKILRELEAANVGLCFVALGAPKQELFAARGRELTPSIGFASIGAGLDFLSGTQLRAPIWVRQFALEWLWRMMTNPRRMAGRYFRSALVLPAHAIASWRQR